jgi:hypothetical protein
MIALVFCVRKYANVSEKEFYEYWWNEHGPYVAQRAKMLNMQNYIQMPRLNFPGAESVAEARKSLPPFDGVALVTWDSNESLQATFGHKDAKRAGRELIEDERKFIDFEKSTIFFTDWKPVVVDGETVPRG